MLTFHPGFVRRRKEKITLLDETAGRRQMSVDYEVPPGTRPMQWWRGEQMYYAPLLFLQKGSDDEFDPTARLTDPEPHFANFDFRDQAGRAMSLPPRAWNALVSTETLRVVFRDAVNRQNETLDPDYAPGIDDLLRDVCVSGQLRAIGLLVEIRDGQVLSPEESFIREMDKRDSTFRRLLDACSISSVVAVPLTEKSLSGILKLSYDEQVQDLPKGAFLKERRARLGWSGLSFWWGLPYAGADTYHFEIEAPAGLEIYDAGLVDVRGRTRESAKFPGRGTERARASGEATRVHLYAPSAARTSEMLAWVSLRVRRHEFIGGAWAASVLVASALWVAYIFRNEVQNTPTSVPALLLLFPSVVAGYAARPDTHRLTARMLRLARKLLVTAAALPFIAAGALAVAERDMGKVDTDSFAHIWLGLAIVGTIIAVLLTVSSQLPVPQITAQRRAEQWGLDISRQYQPRPHPEALIAKRRRLRAERRAENAGD